MFLLSTLTAVLLLSTTAIYAKDNNNTHKADIQRLHQVVQKEAMQHKKALPKEPKEITQALQQTMSALQALHDNNTTAAKDALNQATKLFDTVLKNNPKLSLIPVADAINIQSFTGDSKLVKKSVETSQKLLDGYDTQAARAMLLPLIDEMDMTTEYLPMKAYPLAIKKAVEKLNNGKTKEAFSIIETAFHEMVVKTVIIPLPLITAQSLVADASKLDKTKKEQALKLLSVAEDELQKAIYLGYTKKHMPEYKALQQKIEDIQKEIKGKNIVAKLYEDIKKDFTSLLSKHEAQSAEKKQK